VVAPTWILTTAAITNSVITNCVIKSAALLESQFGYFFQHDRIRHEMYVAHGITNCQITATPNFAGSSLKKLQID
jgi:hypothetical protein